MDQFIRKERPCSTRRVKHTRFTKFLTTEQALHKKKKKRKRRVRISWCLETEKEIACDQAPGEDLRIKVSASKAMARQEPVG